MTDVALDTSVIIEYIDLKGRFHSQAEGVFAGALTGELTALIPHAVLAEAYYVSHGIYKTLGLMDAAARTEKLIEWLYRSPNMEIVSGTLDLALESGRIKRDFGPALTDSYVIAAAKLHKGKALFKKRETEMSKQISSLVKEYPLVFLEDY